jgi:hypothetical protein
VDTTEPAESVISTDACRLRDGLAVLIRPVRPADDGLLAAGLAAELDHHDHEALGALDHAHGGGVGIAFE